MTYFSVLFLLFKFIVFNYTATKQRQIPFLFSLGVIKSVEQIRSVSDDNLGMIFVISP